jgi:hypothetical protein
MREVFFNPKVGNLYAGKQHFIDNNAYFILLK